MACAQSRRTIQHSANDASGPRVAGALLQLMRVLVDIAGNTFPADSPELEQSSPAVGGGESERASVPHVAPPSELDQTGGRSDRHGRRVERPAPSREVTKTSVTPARAEGD